MSLADLTSPDAVQRAIAEFDRLGRDSFLDRYGYRRSRRYFLRIGRQRYDSKAIVGRAIGYQFPDRGPMTPDEFSGGDATVSRKLQELGFEVEVDGQSPSEGEAEVLRRQQMWDSLLERGGPDLVAPNVLRQIGIYGGAQGVWVDAATTRESVPGSGGVAVGLLHTGKHYPDAIDDHGAIYHYPTTKRKGGRDDSEINAIRVAGDLHIPMFLIEHASGGRRRVRRAWLVRDDSRARTFYLTFHEEDAAEIESEASGDDLPFNLNDAADRTAISQVRARRGQARFRFDVFQRYGVACVVCDLAIDELLEAAHLKPRAKKGTNDPRNGLPLCRNHHRAFDAGLFGVDPGTLDLVFGSDGPTGTDLGIVKTSLTDLGKRPHRSALEWAWRMLFDER